MTTVESVRVGNVEAKKLTVAIMDLSTISKCIKIQLAGIIGYNFMKDYRVIIDYPNKQISFEKEKRTRATLRPSNSKPLSEQIKRIVHTVRKAG
jgi:hypothetical protein